MCIKREKKQHMERQVNNIHQYIYINQICIQCMSNNHKTNVQEIMYLKQKEKKRYKNPRYIPQINTPPISYTNPSLMSMTTLISKLLPLFVTSDKWQVNQVDISSSLGELSSSSSASSALSEPSSLSSLDALGEGEEATVKPPITACCHAIRSTRVFT